MQKNFVNKSIFSNAAVIMFSACFACSSVSAEEPDSGYDDECVVDDEDSESDDFYIDISEIPGINELYPYHIYHVEQPEGSYRGTAWFWQENDDGTATLTGYEPSFYIDETGELQDCYLLPS